jgi:hypothetical protein
MGTYALFYNTTGRDNLAAGIRAQLNTTTGSFNTGLGTETLASNTTGLRNVAISPYALALNTSGTDNVATGYQVLHANRTGTGNVAAGTKALYRSTGSRNIGIGRDAGANLTSGSLNIDIAHAGVAGESGRIRIGTPGEQTAAFLAGVNGVSIAGPAKPVLVNASGQLGTATTAADGAVGAEQVSARLLAQDRRIARQAAALKRQQRELDWLRRQVLKGR